jgi:hypothetical protein
MTPITSVPTFRRKTQQHVFINGMMKSDNYILLTQQLLITDANQRLLVVLLLVSTL